MKETGRTEASRIRSFQSIEINARGLLGESESDNAIAALVVELSVAARRDDDILLAVNRIGRRRCIHAGARLELPQHRTCLGIIGLEIAVTFAGESKAAGGCHDAADHRLRR